MKKLNLFACALGLAALAAVPAAVAKILPDADTREVRAYTLTDASFAKYVNATHKLREVKFENCVDDDDDDDAQDTIASSVARIDAVPGAKAAIQGAGLTSREYVVLSFALLENGMASYLMQTPGGKMPENINPANVEFVRKHSAELHQLANETEDESCEHDDND
jgi:hypothetical protein